MAAALALPLLAFALPASSKVLRRSFAFRAADAHSVILGRVLQASPDSIDLEVHEVWTGPRHTARVLRITRGRAHMCAPVPCPIEVGQEILAFLRIHPITGEYSGSGFLPDAEVLVHQGKVFMAVYSNTPSDTVEVSPTCRPRGKLVDLSVVRQAVEVFALLPLESLPGFVDFAPIPLEYAAQLRTSANPLIAESARYIRVIGEQ